MLISERVFALVEMVMKVKLVVDSKDVEMNPYVELVFVRVVDALIGTLKDVDGWKKVRLEVQS